MSRRNYIQFFILYIVCSNTTEISYLLGFLFMTELVVVHSNLLIDASYNVTTDEMRVILLASAKIDSRGKSSGTVELFPSEYSEYFGVSNKNVYRVMRDAAKTLGRKPVVMPVSGTSKKKEIYWISEQEYDSSDNGTSLKISFTDKIIPHLFELKENYGIALFKQAAKLRSPFAVRLYQQLMKHKSLRSSREGEAIVVTLEVDQLKSLGGYHGVYKTWSNFKARVVAPCVKLINDKTDISVIWEPVRRGRVIYAVKFSYILEESTNPAPARPRLMRRPKVAKGSAKELDWMRENLARLKAYKAELAEYDPTALMDIRDLERMLSYSKLLDRVTHMQVKEELAQRKRKKSR